jgi:hypothetical protein
VNVFEEVKKGLAKALERLPEIEKISIEVRDGARRRPRTFIVRSGKLVPLFRIKVSIIQMPPALDKKQIEEATKKAVYEATKRVLANVFKIEEPEKYFDLPEIQVYVNIRSF